MHGRRLYKKQLPSRTCSSQEHTEDRTKHTVPGEVGKPHLVEQIMEDEKWEQVVWFYQKVISLIKDKGCQH
jgi:hypothetical protein